MISLVVDLSVGYLILGGQCYVGVRCDAGEGDSVVDVGN